MRLGPKRSGTESHSRLLAESGTALYPSVRNLDNTHPAAAKLGIRVYTGRLMSEKPETNAPSFDRADERSQMGRDIVALLPRLRRFAAGLTGSVTEGDDIVQTACLRAL